MSQNILGYFTETHQGNIHPKGVAGTNVLLKELAPKKGESILEIGVGTGTTLAKLIPRNPATKFFGIDINEAMLKKANQRLCFSGLGDKITLKQLGADRIIPFDTDYFDKVYVESVLGIQENDELPKMIAEIGRVLKPSGQLFMKELLWSSDTEQKERDTINSLIKKEFGIIQANAKYPSIDHWVVLLNQFHFEILNRYDISTLKMNRFEIPRSHHELLSHLFTVKGRIKSMVSRSLKSEKKAYIKKMSHLGTPEKLDPYIITAFNNKHNSQSTSTQ